jgi:hypothetical protein
MRKKVSTLLDSSLFRRVKLESVVQGKQINEIMGEALELYLRKKGSSGTVSSVVTDSWSALPLDGDQVRRILEDENGLFDA